jgi:MerR family transcriptional regulator, light-induced transcriptional regulator
MKTPPSNAYVSTDQVARVLGVSVSTVKRWVEEGILPAQKTAGGHRRLLLADVLEVARQSNLPIHDLASATHGRRASAKFNAADQSEGLYRALLDGDAPLVRAVLHGAHRGGHSMETIADFLIAPAMHRIGEDWASGRIDVMHEHRATQHCASALYELKPMLETRARRERPIAMGGAIEGDFSELATLLAQMVLLDAGWNAVNLGPNTPLNSLSRALTELKPRMVWLSAAHLVDKIDFLRDYPSFYGKMEAAGVAVVLGGRAFDESLRSKIPYTAFGDGLTHLAAFARTLHPSPRRPKRGRPRA